VSAYDRIAHLYDPWSVSVVEDVAFYLERARQAAGPVVEMAVGTGRIAIPIAAEGIRVVGVDSSLGMLSVALERARLAGIEVGTGATLELRYGDLRDPPLEGAFPLVIIPFRALLHMETDADRRAAVRAVHDLLEPGGTFVFDVFNPGADDIADTHARWLEREPGIYERADWDETTRTLILRVRSDGVESELSLAWISIPEWRELVESLGFTVEGLYGWFDGTPWAGHEDAIFVCRRRD
jgi:SAM-dependent methyltransferase